LLRQIAGRYSFGFSFIIVFAVANLYPICYIGLSSFFVHNPLFAGHNISTISLSGWQPVMEVPLIKRTTDSGLVVNIPEAGEESCWDSPLPCTPYFIPDLKLRNPMNIASGFICDAACAAMITR